jgi:tripartite-type tricarboxylate transporter receptor subunit TctC
MKRNTSRLLCAAALALNAGLAAAQGADNFPSKPITLIVPLAPGATVDIETRLYANKLSEQLKSQVLVDFKPGAGTTLGAAYVVRSAPDGYTLLSTSSSFAAAAALYPTLPFDPLNDLAPVSLMSKAPYMLLINPQVPAKNIQEFIALARAKPGAINFGTSGQGGLPHILGEWLHSATNTKVTFVHYKGGAPAYLAVMSGEIQAAYAGLAPMIPQVKAGKVRAIGMTTAERSKLLPDVPSIAEQGVPEYDVSSWIGIFAPSKTPAAVTQKLSTEFARVAKSPDIIKRLEAEGVSPVGSTPEEFRKLYTSELAKLKKLGQDTGLKL